MIPKYGNGILVSIILISGVLIAGCSDQSSGGMTTVPTTAVYNAKYVAGDVIGKTASATENMAYIIIKYDSSTDQYT